MAIGDVELLLGVEARTSPVSIMTGTKRAVFFAEGLIFECDDKGCLRTAEFLRRGRYRCAFRGVVLRGNWERAKTRLAGMGIDPVERTHPLPDDVVELEIEPGLSAWTPIGQKSIDTVTVQLVGSSPPSAAETRPVTL